MATRLSTTTRSSTARLYAHFGHWSKCNHYLNSSQAFWVIEVRVIRGNPFQGKSESGQSDSGYFGAIGILQSGATGIGAVGPDLWLKLWWILGVLRSACYLPLEIGCTPCSKTLQMNRPVYLEDHNFFIGISLTVFFNIHNMKHRLGCKYSSQNILNAKNYNLHIKYAIRDNLPLRGTLTSICVGLGALTSCVFIIWCLYWSRQPRVFRHFTWLFCIYVADLVRPSDPFSMLSLMFEKYIVQNNRWCISWNAPFSQRLGNRRLCLSEDICGPVNFRGVTIFIITIVHPKFMVNLRRGFNRESISFLGTCMFSRDKTISLKYKHSCFHEIILETMCFYVT